MAFEFEPLIPDSSKQGLQFSQQMSHSKSDNYTELHKILSFASQEGEMYAFRNDPVSELCFVSAYFPDETLQDYEDLTPRQGCSCVSLIIDGFETSVPQAEWDELFESAVLIFRTLPFDG